MNTDTLTLTEAEWQVMECLWASSPLTGRELSARLEKSRGWSRSTTLTLLRRLEAKGAVTEEAGAPVKRYSPAISRENAALNETESLLSRVYNGSLSLMVSAFTKKQRLSKEEIDELYALLSELEGEKKGGETDA